MHNDQRNTCLRDGEILIASVFEASLVCDRIGIDPRLVPALQLPEAGGDEDLLVRDNLFRVQTTHVPP